jgi:predicted transcriptional regulator YdeE
MKTILVIVLAVIILLIVLYNILIGNIDKKEPQIVKLNEPIKLIGIEINTNDKNIYKDVGLVASKFNEFKKSNPIPYLKQPWASINISKDYNVETKTFKYIVGDVVTQVDSIPKGLYYYEVPSLTYAIFPIRPKSRIAWGITMGRMKRYIYLEWLPKSGYKPSEIIGDFELHDDRSLRKSPEINLYIALKEKDRN